MAEEPRPLAAFGAEVELAVDAQLQRAGVRILTGAPVRRSPSEDEGGPIEVLVDSRRRSFDRLLALPVNLGPGIGGLAADERGYVRVDAYGRVLGSERLWAAGDCTATVVKHSSLALAQADVTADALAAAVGAPVRPQPFEPVLRGILVPDAAERWWGENVTATRGLPPPTHCLWWPPGRVVGGRLARYIAAHDPTARPYLLTHPHGLALTVRFEAPPPGDAASTAPTDEATARVRQVDSYDRQLFALRRLEREAETVADQLDRLREEDAHSRELLQRLSAAGYVVKEQSPTK